MLTFLLLPKISSCLSGQLTALAISSDNAEVTSLIPGLLAHFCSH